VAARGRGGGTSQRGRPDLLQRQEKKKASPQNRSSKEANRRSYLPKQAVKTAPAGGGKDAMLILTSGNRLWRVQTVRDAGEFWVLNNLGIVKREGIRDTARMGKTTYGIKHDMKNGALRSKT